MPFVFSFHFLTERANRLSPASIIISPNSGDFNGSLVRPFGLSNPSDGDRHIVIFSGIDGLTSILLGNTRGFIFKRSATIWPISSGCIFQASASLGV
jgi:hypothetical protein